MNFKERYCRVNIRGERKDGRNRALKKSLSHLFGQIDQGLKFKGTVSVR